MGSAGYLDAASAEPLHPAARAAMLAALDTAFADPRRRHPEARRARLVLDNAREAVAECLGLHREEVSFTGSGTEAVHRGLLGLVRPGARLAHSGVEHSAVLHAAAWPPDLVVSSVPVDAAGRIDADRIDTPDVVALQHANHEVGTLQPVAEVAARVGVPLFMDACASMGRLPLPDGWTTAAGSAHKWGGPPGVGVLLVRRGARWRTPFPEDDRTDDRVSGFENIPAALGAAAALQAVVAERAVVNDRQYALVDRIRATVAAIPDTDVVGDPVHRLPHLLTCSFLYVDGEAVVDALGRRGFSVDSGSACTASTLEPSHVLAAMGALTHGNIRVSLTRETTEADVEAFLAVLPDVVTEIRRDAGM